MTSIKDDAFTPRVRESLRPYLLPAQQTATAPEDVPWLLRTGRARWPRAETHVNKSMKNIQTLTTRNVYSGVIIHISEG